MSVIKSWAWDVEGSELEIVTIDDGHYGSETTHVIDGECLRKSMGVLSDDSEDLWKGQGVMASKKLEAAISRLADLFEFGHLQASTNPAAFIGQAADEINSIRARADRAEARLVAVNDVVSKWHAYWTEKGTFGAAKKAVLGLLRDVRAVATGKEPDQ